MSENKYLVKKVSVIDTFRNLPIGKSITFDCRELCSYGTAQSAISRLNTSAKAETYKISTTDNGVTYSVIRLR